jgi:epoxide hydrolase
MPPPGLRPGGGIELLHSYGQIYCWSTGCGTRWRASSGTRLITTPASATPAAVFGADETVRKLVPAPPGSHWTEFHHGRHFPAMEAPVDLADDLRGFFYGIS